MLLPPNIEIYKFPENTEDDDFLNELNCHEWMFKRTDLNIYFSFYRGWNDYSVIIFLSDTNGKKILFSEEKLEEVIKGGIDVRNYSKKYTFIEQYHGESFVFYDLESVLWKLAGPPYSKYYKFLTERDYYIEKQKQLYDIIFSENSAIEKIRETFSSVFDIEEIKSYSEFLKLKKELENNGNV